MDLAKDTSICSHKYFVARKVVEAALETSTTYNSYAIAVFEDVFQRDVAIYCRCDRETYCDDNSVDKLLAILPQEPFDVYLGKTFAFYIN